MEQEMTEILLANRSELYRTAWRYLRNEQDTLEALQEVSYRAYKNLRTIRDPRYIKTWVIRILIHYCLDELKRRKRTIPVDTFPGESMSSSPLGTDDKLYLENKLHHLDEKYQLILVLKYYHQYTLTEIASSLKIPLGTVKTRLNHGLRLLREQIEREDT
ncbi:MAG: sigma-70 family RNA polymerase sigma factor [Sporolactobacillus sp.]